MKTILILLTIVAVQVTVMLLIQWINEVREERLARLREKASRKQDRRGVEQALIRSYMESINR